MEKHFTARVRIVNLLTVSAVVILLFSCKNDKSAKLDRLRQKQAEISRQIKELESQQSENAPDTTKFKFVSVTEVRPGSFDHYIRVQGRIDGDQNASVFAEVPGTVTERYADVGNKVTKGQVLAQLDDTQVRNQLQGLETQYNLASELFEKQQRLWEQKIGSEVQYLQSRTNKESLEKQINTLKDQLEKFKIRSPIAGTVEEVNVRIGTVVSPDPRLAAFRVVAFRNMKVVAEVSEAYSSMVNAGAKLLISFPDIDREIVSKVDFVSKYISPVNRTFTIESEIPSDIEDLKANMVAVIRINDYHKENAIQLPMNVIQTDLSGSYVYKVQPSNQYYVTSKQKVEVGNSYNGMAEITSGLKEGDLVVSTGYQDLMEGEYVRY